MPWPRDAAVFVDRDGVINRRRADHVKSWTEFEFLPGSLLALRRLHCHGARVIVITNQSVVGRGLISQADLAAIHRRMSMVVRINGGLIEAIYACTHTPTDNCGCRKPKPGLLLQAATDLGLDLSRSVLIGDSFTDLEAAWSAGCRAALVRKPPSELMDTRVTVAPDLRDAVAALCTREVAKPEC